MSSKIGAAFCGVLAVFLGLIATSFLGSGSGGYAKLLGLLCAGGAFFLGFYALLLVPRQS